MNNLPELKTLSQSDRIQVHHGIMVSKVAKTSEDLLKDLSPFSTQLLVMAGCICGEAGEIFDAVKQVACYRKPLDIQNLVEELGDMEFYLERLRQEAGITREETLQVNINKLAKRYPNFEYSNQRAHERADKQEEKLTAADWNKKLGYPCHSLSDTMTGPVGEFRYSIIFQTLMSREEFELRTRNCTRKFPTAPERANSDREEDDAH